MYYYGLKINCLLRYLTLLRNSQLAWLVMSASFWGFFFTENNRHADMSRDMSGANTDHAGDIEPCRLLRRRIDVVLA